MRRKGEKFQTSFNAGELSPLLDGRTDLDKANNACRVLENYIALRYGCAQRRPGMQFRAVTKFDEDRASRLFSFQFSTTTTYIIEVGHEYMRFYTNGGQVVVGTPPGTPYEISTPYQEEDLFSLQYKQINDVTYIWHPDYPVHKLIRVEDDDWTLEEVVFDVPAVLDQNITDTTITATPTSNPDEVALLASAPIFDPLHVGAYWRIGHLRRANSVQRYFSAGAGTSSTIEVLGNWTVRTYGTWTATILVERSLDEGTTWDIARTIRGEADRNVDLEGNEEQESLLRITLESGATGTGNARVVLESVDAYIYGTVRITAFNDDQNVIADVLDDIYSTDPTDIWAEGAWSDYRGYPRGGCLHEQRLFFGGTRHLPQSVWGSVIGDYENFLRGTADDAGLFFTLAGEELNAIQWMVSQKELLIGTTAGEWAVNSRSVEKALTPTTIHARQQSAYGSQYLRAQLVGEVVIFVQRKGRELHELVYSYEVEKFVAPDLTLLAEHVTEGGVVDMALQKDPMPILWVVTGNGQLAGLTYDREQNVIGWHRHPTQGWVESVATIYGEEDQDDEVWFVVRREIESIERRYVERFNPVKWTEKEDFFGVDSGISYEGTPVTVIGGLDHLEGMTVVALADGNVVRDLLVNPSGEITLPDAASKVHIGFPFTSKLRPVNYDADTQAGVHMGHVKRFCEITVRLLNTLGMTFDNGQKVNVVSFRNSNDPMGSSPPLFSGDKKLEFPSDYAYDLPMTIQQEDPLPSTILAIVTRMDIPGN